MCWGIAEAQSQEEPVDPPVAAADAKDSAKPDRKAFDAAVIHWQNVTAEYATLAVDWHVSEPSAHDRETRIRWGDLLYQSRQAFNAATIEAIKLVEIGLRHYPDVSVFLLQSVMYRSELEWFELSGPSVAVLLSQKKDTEQLLQETSVERGKMEAFAAISYFMTEDFDNAEKFLTLAEKAGALDVKFSGLLSAIPQVRELAKAEYHARDKDANRGDLPRVRLDTSKGPIVIELFEDDAPGTVANFISLVEKGFYDGNPFYQVIKGTMAMTGDPNGDGSGNAGYHIEDENQLPTARPIVRGALSMAKLPDPSGGSSGSVANSASSQFIIALAPFGTKKSGMTIFGRIVEGIDTVVMLTELKVDEAGKKGQKAPDLIFRAEVLRKRDHAYEPVKVELPGVHGHVH